MYAQSEFPQSHYVDVTQYSLNYQPHVGDWYYPAQESWRQADNDDPVTAILKKRRENQKIIENFVEECRESITGDKKAKRDDRKMFKISEAREVMITVYRTQKKLESMSQELKESESLSESQWEEKWQRCTELQDKLNELMVTLESPEGVINDLKKRLEQRRKKRRRESRKKTERKAEKALAAERRLRRHAEADAWIREKQDIIEREKQSELLRKDADIVLADVRGKRSDAKKFLALLHELQNLRRIKVNIARARGENLPLAADQAFDNIIGELLDQWTSLDREYSIEEQGLKLMLKSDNEQKIEKQKQSTFDQWESLLFGRKLQSYDPCRGDIHTLVMIRYAWDKYSNYNGKGSRIPIGWVMPVAPSSAAWQKCLRRK